MKKVFQVLTVAAAAYSFYKAVSDFLETDTGLMVKERSKDYFEQAKDMFNNVAEEAQDKTKNV